LCAFIGGWVICPWEILSRAVGFLNFMAGYTVVLGPIAGIMISDVGTNPFANLNSSCFSTGLYTVERSTFRRSTGRKAAIGIQVVWYGHISALILCADVVTLSCLQNWRAAVALLVSVPPNLPGLINAINPNIDVHGSIYPYQVSWILGFVIASSVYTITSYASPAEETMIEETIWDDSLQERQTSYINPLAHTISRSDSKGENEAKAGDC